MDIRSVKFNINSLQKCGCGGHAKTAKKQPIFFLIAAPFRRKTYEYRSYERYSPKN